MPVYARTVPVMERHRFDVASLDCYLRGHLPGYRGGLEVQQFDSGHSNPTFFLSAEMDDGKRRDFSGRGEMGEHRRGALEHRLIFDPGHQHKGAKAGHLAAAGVGIAIVIHPEVPDLDAYDEGRLAERILLAAAAQGLGAAVGHFTGPGDTWAASAEAKRLLRIPERFVLRETISLGYPAAHLEKTPNPPGRKPLDQLVHLEHY